MTIVCWAADAAAAGWLPAAGGVAACLREACSVSQSLGAAECEFDRRRAPLTILLLSRSGAQVSLDTTFSLMNKVSRALALSLSMCALLRVAHAPRARAHAQLAVCESCACA